jgi:hypothetical protein
MAKGYPIDLPLQTKLAAESSIVHRHIQYDNCGMALPRTWSIAAHNEFSGAACHYQLDRAR